MVTPPYTVVVATGDGQDRRFFGCYENAYAYQSRQARFLLEAHPNWKQTYDHEEFEKDKGTWYRFIIFSNKYGKSVPKASIRLEGVQFSDNLVELYPQQYLESDYPRH